MKPEQLVTECCDQCGAGAYRCKSFYYLEAWGEDFVAGDGMGFSLRKKRLLCQKCGEALWAKSEPKS